MFAAMNGALWHRLVAERGWSDERFAEWLGNLWMSQLVKLRHIAESCHSPDARPRGIVERYGSGEVRVPDSQQTGRARTAVLDSSPRPS